MPLSSVPPAPPPDQAIVLFHDARAVRDIASLRPEDYGLQGHPAWVVAKVTPGPDSGASSVPGAFVDGQTGKIVQPPGTQAVVTKDGTWKALMTAPQSSQYAGGSYSWSERLAQRKRSLSPEDYYSPFVSGGIVLFRPLPGASEMDQFEPARLLFSDWGQYVAPAFDFVRQHSRLFDEVKLSPDEITQLTRLLSERNGLLAVLAFRQLLLAAKMGAIPVSQNLFRADERAAAIFTYLALTAPTHQTEIDQALEGTLDAVRSSQDLTRLRSIGLGCFAAALFNPGTRGAVEAKRALEAIRVRLKQLGRAAGRDQELDLIFEKMNVSL